MVPELGPVPIGFGKELEPFEGKDWLVGVGGWEEWGGIELESLLCDRCDIILLAGTEIGGSNEKVIDTGPIALVRSISHLP